MACGDWNPGGGVDAKRETSSRKLGVKIIKEAPQISAEIIATSAEVTPNKGLVKESPQNDLNSGLGIIVICPEIFEWAFVSSNQWCIKNRRHSHCMGSIAQSAQGTLSISMISVF